LNGAKTAPQSLLRTLRVAEELAEWFDPEKGAHERASLFRAKPA
jgi:hypothetical protein